MCCLVSNAIETSKRQIAAAAIIGLIMIFIPAMTYSDFYRKVHSTREPWEQTSKWLMAQEDKYNKNALVVLSTWGSAIGGFKYYITHNSEGKGIDIVTILDAKTLDGIDKLFHCVLHSDILNKSYMEAEFNLETNVNEVPIRIYNRIID
jgi:hypothetical protein